MPWRKGQAQPRPEGTGGGLRHCRPVLSAYSVAGARDYQSSCAYLPPPVSDLFPTSIVGSQQRYHGEIDRVNSRPIQDTRERGVFWRLFEQGTVRFIPAWRAVENPLCRGDWRDSLNGWRIWVRGPCGAGTRRATASSAMRIWRRGYRRTFPCGRSESRSTTCSSSSTIGSKPSYTTPGDTTHRSRDTHLVAWRVTERSLERIRKRIAMYQRIIRP